MTSKPGKKELLLEAGLDAFYASGFDNTTIDEIVNRANCGKGTFYRYFPNKDSLLEELDKNFSDHLAAELKKNCLPDMQVREYLLSGLKTYISIFKKYHKLGMVKFGRENRLRAEDIKKSVHRVSANIYYLRDYIQKSVENKTIRAINPESVIVLLLGAGHFMLFRDFKLGLPFSDRELEDTVDIIIKGVLP